MAHAMHQGKTGGPARIAALLRLSTLANDGGRRARADLADGQLVTLALNGDRSAFARLMDRHAGKLRRVVERRVRCPEETADLLQDTYLSAWRALSSYCATRPFELWLICIALNKCRDWGRRRTVRYRAAGYLQTWAWQDQTGADEDMIEHQRLDALRGAMATLPAALREPLVLVTMNGLSQKDAASRLGVTVKSIETRVRRARLKLRDLLEPLMAVPALQGAE